MTISPEQRKRFEKAGLELVQADYVAGGRRVIHGGDKSRPNALTLDRMAAQEWIAEKSRHEKLRRRLMMAFVAVAATGAVIAAVPVVKSWISN